MCIADLTSNMVEPRVLTPAERLEALLQAAVLEGLAAQCTPAEAQLRSRLLNTAEMLRRIAT